MKLIDILKELSELSLQKGHASSKSSEDIGLEGMQTLLSVKGMDKYDFVEDPERNKLVEPLLKDIFSKHTPVNEEGPYKLVLKIQSGEYVFYLINTEASTVDMVFAGIMRLEKYNGDWMYSFQKAFDLKVLQVHWSNIGVEYRGKGLGKIMYTLVYEYVSEIGYAMASDSMLFEGSSGMWRTYMPGIASYFGIMIDDVLLPVTKADVANTSLIEKSKLDGFVAMENPPKLIRKIAHNVEGLSFANNEYGMITLGSDSINDKLAEFDDQRFMDVIDEFDSLKQVAKKFNKFNDIKSSSPKKIDSLKCLILAFEDAIIAVKQVGDRIVVQPI